MTVRASPRRVLGGIALVAGVLAVHACVTAEVAGRMEGMKSDATMPARIEVAYVREMQLAVAPPAAAAPAPPPAPVMAARRSRARKAMAAASAASAPEPTVAMAEPASSPEPAPEPPEPASASASAASEPAIAAESPASAASAAGPAFQWPASTRVRYHLTGNYRGAVDGSAQVEWIRVGSHYQVHVDFIVGPSFAPVITQRSTSDGEIGAAGLIPNRYDQQVKVLGSQRPLQTIRFDPFGITFANGERSAAPPNVQDSASQFIQLTWLFSTRPELLAVGASLDIPLALPRKVDTWTYDVTEQVALQTPFGELASLHLVPRGPTKPGSLRVEMWYAPQLRYFPARLRIEQNDTNYVELTIEKPPEMANEERDPGLR